jgi:hypothetical protein
MRGDCSNNHYARLRRATHTAAPRGDSAIAGNRSRLHNPKQLWHGNRPARQFRGCRSTRNGLGALLAPNSEPTLAWHRGQVISQSATGPRCIIQSDIGTESGHRGNLEVVVQEGDHITHEFHDSSAPTTPWVRGLSFGQGVTGGPSIIQSDFKSGGHGNFEVVVLEGSNLMHYWHDNSNMALPWQRGQTNSIAATGGGTIIQSYFKSGGYGNFRGYRPGGRSCQPLFTRQCQPRRAGGNSSTVLLVLA